MRPDSTIKQEIQEEVIEAQVNVREGQMTVDEEIAEVEELERQLMAAELLAAQEREQQEKGRELQEQISEVGGS